MTTPTQIQTPKHHFAAPMTEQYWHFTPWPAGKKVQLLTIGGVCVYGVGMGKLGEYFTAWAPLLERPILP